MHSYDFFVACPRGLEGLLVEEVRQLTGQTVKEQPAGARFHGTLANAYAVLCDSRLSNRLLLSLAEVPAADSEQLYQGVHGLDWAALIGDADTLAVDFHGTSAAINNSQFGAQRVKDAVVDRLREALGRRPSVDRVAPEVLLNARLKRDQLTLSLDLGGGSLHRRGYRRAGAQAPLKENLAAGLLLRAGWPAIAARGGALIDPLCGSGTLVIEAALMAADIAPGLLRDHPLGSPAWHGHDRAAWAAVLADAERRRQAGLARGLPPLAGSDQDPQAIRAARDNAQRAGVAEAITWTVQPLTAARPPAAEGLLISNPPYGERLGELSEAQAVHSALGRLLRAHFAGWQAAVFTGNPALGKQMGLRSHRQYKLFNGALPCTLLLFDVRGERFVGAADAPPPLTEGARMVANRLRKNQQRLRKWLRDAETDAYRLYDADIPEYAAAVDVYGEQVHVQEYAAPASVDPAKAQARLSELVAAVADSLALPPAQIAVKQRRRQRGKAQYEKQAQRGERLQVQEGRARFWVNLHDYLDTGLFLDHRPLRRRLFEEADGKRFLNLFCYTATATVQAALGGARESLSVDLSNTYLDWARDNFRLNNLDEQAHRLKRADCLRWLRDARETFDLILLDPPTFSTSKAMADTLDIQRDHAELVRLAMDRLSGDGVLYFSNNFRRFQLDPALSEDYAVADITAATVDADFARRPDIHHCFAIRHRR